MKKLEIIVRTITTKEGKSFNAYKVVLKNGTLMDLKFRRAVKDLPTKGCIAVVEDKNISVDRNRKYPCMWVHQVERFEELGIPEVDKEIEDLL